MKNIKIPEKLSGGEEIEDFGINQVIRQKDGLSTSLFILALDSIINKCNVKGAIINKETQIFACVDDFTVLAKDKRNLEEAVQEIKPAAKKRGLEINQGKSKHMKISKINRES